MSALPGLEVFSECEHAESVVREEGLERVVAQVGVHRHGVGDWRKRSRVGTCGGGDVAALAVRDHEQARLPRVAAHVGERGPALGALRLEERRLRLDGHRDPGDRVDDAVTELDDAEPLRHQRRIRIEADAERRALALHRGCEPIREMTRPAHRTEDTGTSGKGFPEKQRGRPKAASRSSEETLDCR